jgi:hypothetical protein
MQLPEDEITLSTVVGWAWSTFFIILAIAMLSGGLPGAGSCLLFSAVVMLPPARDFAFQNLGTMGRAWLSFFVAITLMITAGWQLGFLASSSPPVATYASSSSSAPASIPQAVSPAPLPLVPSTKTPHVASRVLSPAGAPLSTQFSDQTDNSESGVIPGADNGQTAPTSSAVQAMQSRFGNTVITRRPGSEWHLYFNRDGTFSGQEIISRYRVSGAWRAVGAYVCVTYTPPLPSIQNPDCKPVSPQNVGDTWIANGVSSTLMQGIR